MQQQGVFQGRPSTAVISLRRSGAENMEATVTGQGGTELARQTHRQVDSKRFSAKGDSSGQFIVTLKLKRDETAEVR